MHQYSTQSPSCSPTPRPPPQSAAPDQTLTTATPTWPSKLSKTLFTSEAAEARWSFCPPLWRRSYHGNPFDNGALFVGYKCGVIPHATADLDGAEKKSARLSENSAMEMWNSFILRSCMKSSPQGDNQGNGNL
ncbi:hypothetical protein F2P81_000762 [Scophthalmus maximus]|uniref:Uncharacterized protein n=1 Tax=Scophthalmus maximus TaxID=52904 RepID=A0A6A4TQG8_SCOMX|nr:hypothetical protein F2P81_000762 [Scophthalmus maximus]